jgi:hypothetical protein
LKNKQRNRTLSILAVLWQTATMKGAILLLLAATVCLVGAHAHQHPKAVDDAVQNRQLLALSW